MPSSRVLSLPSLACVLLLGLLLSMASAWAWASGDGEPKQDAAAAEEISGMLREFLSNVGQASTHERFWAADLVYTSSDGEVRSKHDIMKGFDQPPPVPAAASATPGPVYSAEDILVRAYGDGAALTFRLVANAADGSRTDYRNSGMFVRRDGRWQAVTWQATRVPTEFSK